MKKTNSIFVNDLQSNNNHMKRLILSATIALLSVALYAQDAHLKFKGIPIEGNYKTFAQKLVQKGFKQEDISDDGIVLTGNFMAIPEVMVLVYPDPSSKVVTMVTAMIETGNKWAQVESKYYDVVDTYKEKYGAPTEHVEEFTAEVYDSDTWRKSRLEDGQCNYKTLWELKSGRIVISPTYFNYKYYIVCAYVDDQNSKVLRQTIIDDI